MKIHTRHVVIAIIVMVLLALGSIAARAQDFSGYSGAQLYARFCASCHGLQGHGDGPVASNFKIIVPDLTRIARRQGGTFREEQVRRVIDGRAILRAHGSREMPVWGFEFQAQGVDKPDPSRSTDELITRLTAHVRAMQEPRPSK